MKFWLTGVTTNGEGDNLRELIDPIIDQFDGLIWTFHNPNDFDGGFNYLWDNKKEGEIINSPWVRRLDHSRNKTLFEGPMKEGDWFLVIDDKERIHPDFISFLKKDARHLESSVRGYAYEGKRLFYRYHEALSYQGNPHEGLKSNGQTVNIQHDSVPAGWFSNVRGEQRDEFQWIGHYLKYYFFPNTNHLLLGYESNIDYVKQRYFYREQVKNFMLCNNYRFTLDGFKKMIQDNPNDSIIKGFLNSEKILNDWYRYEILNERDMIDSHNPKLIKEI